eukprot:2835045-Amphidinium_carterae.1
MGHFRETWMKWEYRSHGKIVAKGSVSSLRIETSSMQHLHICHLSSSYSPLQLRNSGESQSQAPHK